MHCESQAELQQAPSAQYPEEHSLAAEHASPSCFSQMQEVTPSEAWTQLVPLQVHRPW